MQATNVPDTSPERRLSELAARVADGSAGPEELFETFLSATVFCERPAEPGFVAIGEPGEGVIPVFSSLEELAAHVVGRDADVSAGCGWFSTTGEDLLDCFLTATTWYWIRRAGTGCGGGRRRGGVAADARGVGVVGGCWGFAVSWGFDVDLGFLKDAAGQVGDAVTLAREMERRGDELDGYVAKAGLPAVREAAAEFLERWRYGVDLVGADASKVADGLRACAEVYADVEDSVVDAAGSIADTLAPAASAVGDAVGDAADTVGETVTDTADAAADAVGDAVGTIRGVLG